MKVRLYFGVVVALVTAFPGAGAQVDPRQPDTQWTYKTVEGKGLAMDVFLPPQYASGRRFPVFVVFHGGSWEAGEPSWHYPDCAYWSSRGMVAASVDYRLKTRDQVDVPLECVKDAKSALRFLRQNADDLKLDAGRIVAAGGSAGGQMAAAVAMIGEANDDCYDLSISCVPNAVILYNPYFKCRPDLSPPHFIKKGLPPFITFLGDQDPAITVEELHEFHAALKAAGNDSEYYVGPGGKHGFCNGRNPMNPFFYWSLELEDRFLVKHGILSGEATVQRPAGVGEIRAAETGKSVGRRRIDTSALFESLDRDHNCFVSLEEYIEECSSAPLQPDVAGAPHRDEIRAYYAKQFARRDRNRDGVLTPDEI